MNTNLTMKFISLNTLISALDKHTQLHSRLLHKFITSH